AAPGPDECAGQRRGGVAAEAAVRRAPGQEGPLRLLPVAPHTGQFSPPGINDEAGPLRVLRRHARPASAAHRRLEGGRQDPLRQKCARIHEQVLDDHLDEPGGVLGRRRGRRPGVLAAEVPGRLRDDWRCVRARGHPGDAVHVLAQRRGVPDSAADEAADH
ncbi:unnamed protein product, partial [Prorocentrum cordatum]